MGSFSIWHWLVILIFFGVPVLAIATERSDRILTRGGYGLWLSGTLLFGLVGQQLNFGSATLFVIACGLLIHFLYNRAVALRPREAGHGKGLAYLGILPLLKILLAIYLLVRPPADNPEQIASD
jgi:hypothetical protein